MYKKALSSIMLVPLAFLFCFLCLRGSHTGETGEQNPAPYFRLGIADMAASGQRVVDCQLLEQDYVYSFDEDELDVLLRIVEAEAGCEDEDGRLLVANVVLNRMESERFPDTITEVVFQQGQGVTQFSPVASGSIWRVKVSDETRAAVERALLGEDLSQGALFFASRKYADSAPMSWFDTNLTFLFEHGGHEFFK